MDDVKVQVRGLAELRKAFRDVSKDIPKEMGRAFKAVAETVAGRARAKVPSRSGRAASSIVARGSQRGAAIAFGGTRAEYFPWLDFGGSVGRGHKPGQAWSGAIKREWMGLPNGQGRYVYPAIRQSRPEIEQAADAAIVAAARRAEFDFGGRP